MNEPREVQRDVAAEVDAQRERILRFAGDELVRATARRQSVRRNTVLAAAAILLSVLFLPLLQRTLSTDTSRIVVTKSPRECVPPQAPLDFAVATSPSRKLDFAIIEAVPQTKIVRLSDRELENALIESGHCSKVFRIGEAVKLVDCSTGLPVNFQ
ncbi:MAG: hypothetical protein RL591_82 [Planctomycetota bacterium]|jgi:hypothetical protein